MTGSNQHSSPEERDSRSTESTPEAGAAGAATPSSSSLDERSASTRVSAPADLLRDRIPSAERHEDGIRLTVEEARELLEQYEGVTAERDAYHDALAALGEHDARGFMREAEKRSALEAENARLIEQLETLQRENMQLGDELGSLSLHIEMLQEALQAIADSPARSSSARACVATAIAALNPASES